MCKKTTCHKTKDFDRLLLSSHHLQEKGQRNGEANNFYLKSCPADWAHFKEYPSPLKLYRWRWGIESLFECLKTRGFRMEDTRMTSPEKIEKLLFILAIAVCWAYKIGELQARKKPIPIKKHGRKLKSIFRLGLDLIRHALFRENETLLEELTVLPYLGLTAKGGVE